MAFTRPCGHVPSLELVTDKGKREVCFLQGNRDSSLGGSSEVTGERDRVRVLRKGWEGAVERAALLLIREADCSCREKSHEWGAWWVGMGLRWPILLAFLGILFFNSIAFSFYPYA